MRNLQKVSTLQCELCLLLVTCFVGTLLQQTLVKRVTCFMQFSLSYPLPVLVKLNVTKLRVACSASVMIEVLMQRIKGDAACRLFERAMAGWCCAWERCHHTF